MRFHKEVGVLFFFFIISLCQFTQSRATDPVYYSCDDNLVVVDKTINHKKQGVELFENKSVAVHEGRVSEIEGTTNVEGICHL